MKKLALIIALFLVASIATADDDYTCRVITGNQTAHFARLCPMLEVRLGNPADWSANICATRFMQRGMVDLDSKQQKLSARDQVAASESTIKADMGAATGTIP